MLHEIQIFFKENAFFENACTLYDKENQPGFMEKSREVFHIMEIQDLGPHWNWKKQDKNWFNQGYAPGFWINQLQEC